MPDRPAVPTVASADLQCLSDDAYEALAVRDQVRVEHIRRLEAIILTTRASE